MCIIFFKKVYRESGLRLIYSEEELDFLEGEFAKNQFPSREMREAYAQRLGVLTRKLWRYGSKKDDSYLDGG